MNIIGTLVVVAGLAASAPLRGDPVAIPEMASDAGEVYVAELDVDWNVAREIRMACDIDRGCAVDLPLADVSEGRLHVRFDPVRRGKVDVESTIADPSGHAVVQPNLSLSLDRNGFGATHVGPDRPRASSGGQRIIMMAVRVPGFLAPAARLPGAGQAI